VAALRQTVEGKAARHDERALTLPDRSFDGRALHGTVKADGIPVRLLRATGRFGGGVQIASASASQSIAVWRWG
jgi:hypothetical protein